MTPAVVRQVVEAHLSKALREIDPLPPVAYAARGSEPEPLLSATAMLSQTPREVRVPSAPQTRL